MALSVPAAQSPPAIGEIRLRVLETLRTILVRAEDDPLEVGVIEGGGLSVALEVDDVRCLLLFDLLRTSPTLSPREMQIARLVARGATNRSIASTLDISSWTVSTHLRRVFAKLGVSNRAEMVNQLFAAPQPRPVAQSSQSSRSAAPPKIPSSLIS